MPNLRILHDNAIDRATLAASSTAGSLVSSNMLIDRKSKVWRSVGTNATLTLTWTAAEYINGIALPFCNLSSTAVIRATLFTNTTDSVALLDTGYKLASRFVAKEVWNWGNSPTGVNAYSYGGGTYGVSWFDKVLVKKVLIEIIDTDNTSGYVECSRLVIGNYWSPKYNTSFGLPVALADNSTNTRSESGDLITTRGTRHKVLSFDLSWLEYADRNKFNSIMRNNGIPKPLFVSLFPEDTDAEKEKLYEIYGKLSQISPITHSMPTIYSGHIDIEEV